MTDYLDRQQGLEALRRPAGARQSTFAIERHKTTCLVGPERRRQDHAVQRHHRLRAAGRRRDHVRRQAAQRRSRRARSSATASRAPSRTCALFDEMTALDNVIVYLRDDEATGPLDGVVPAVPHQRRAEAQARGGARRCSTDVDLAHKADDIVRNLSFGQQKLLCIARVLATGAELLLLDEPTSGLSQSALTAMVEMVHKLREQRPDAAGRRAQHPDRAAHRRRDRVPASGRAHGAGRTRTILTDPKLAEIYFGGVV